MPTPRAKRLDEEQLVDIAKSHFSSKGLDVNRVVSRKWMEVRNDRRSRLDRQPSTAEYLDTVAACIELGIAPETERWEQVKMITLMCLRVMVEGVDGARRGEVWWGDLLRATSSLGANTMKEWATIADVLALELAWNTQYLIQVERRPFSTLAEMLSITKSSPKYFRLRTLFRRNTVIV